MAQRERRPAAWLAAQCERVRLQAMCAIDEARGGSHSEALRGRLRAVEARLALVRIADAPPAEPDLRRERDDRLGPLAQRLGTSPLLTEFIWAVIAASVDPRIAPHLETLTGERPRGGVTATAFAAVHRLDEGACTELTLALSPSHPWFTSGLLLLGDGALAPLRPITASRRLCLFVAGDDAFDDELRGAGGEVPLPPAALLGDAQAAIVARLREVFTSEPGARVFVHGLPGAGRRTALALAAASAARPAVYADLARLPRDRMGLERALTALAREAALRQAFPILVGVEEVVTADPQQADGARTVARFVDGCADGCGLVATHPSVELPVSARLLRLAWPTPDGSARRAMWDAALATVGAPSAAGVVAEVATRYPVGVGTIGRAGRAAANLAGLRGKPAVDAIDIRDSMRAEAAEKLSSLATLVPTSHAWADIVLPADILDQVRGLVARARHAHQVFDAWGFGHAAGRATGIAALLSGPPGTGKTMLAGVIAAELGLDLYQIELSRVVSKWIGETEKAIGTIFDAAATGQVLLLFDEADSLFAKRTEVKSSVDRYANLEVNYLLQRVESFTGMTLLTTNLDTSIDPALRRRLAAHIRFYAPDESERETLWTRMLRSDAPTDADVDCAELAATFADFTGANIRNAVLGAAFLAAAERVPLSQALLERAARSEAASMGRVLGAPPRR